ncbi:MAG: 4-hydroxythreonine-4-phosphate dehydrogenase PdxA [Endomicrobium sp.]|nr:4-hydroxythreonine-4-phosphate dehydrogenase PdxA [Endomicrobium sp.]
MHKSDVAITLGDPSGIGYEIVQKAVNSSVITKICNPIVFGDVAFSKYFKNNEYISSSNNGKLKIGYPSAKSGIAAISAIHEAVKYCMNKKNVALINAPVSKKSLKMAGEKHEGHTELLAYITKSENFAMMFSCNNIHSVIITRHIPVKKISSNIKTENIIKTINLAINFLRKINKKNIRIGLCGLNPHAGDNSILGSEEKKIILPAYKILKKSGINITKPLPADSIWLKAKSGYYDLVCSMYHDQAMIPLKCINNKKIVNITIGLPFLRTSPGHGTAFDIAGKNIADATAMKEAIIYAVRNGQFIV